MSARLKQAGLASSDLTVLSNWQQTAAALFLMFNGQFKVAAIENLFSNNTDTIVLLLNYNGVFKDDGLQKFWF